MAKGISPLRLFMRNAPRKTLAEGTDGSSSGPDGTGAAAAQSRQPLGPISETVRNPLVSAAEQSSGDPSTPRAKAEISSNGQEKFSHLENSEVYTNSINISPDKAASSQSKGKFSWQLRRGSTAQNTLRDGAPSLTTPPRPPKGSACSDGQDTSQGLSHHLRGCITGGGSVPKTPRSDGSKSSTESENGGSQSQNVTPCKTVSRSLKYSQQGSANNSGASGLMNVRSTVSQHVITRPMGYLHAVKGVLPQTTNQNFVEHHFELEEDASFWRDHNVQVIIRTRPLSHSELTLQVSNRCLKQESPHVVSWLGQPESRFTFDHVAGETITQAKLFDVAGLPMVENCMSGYNSCMFAYGQTGSGKTHTMLGDIENLDRSPSENRGMTPRVFEYLFARIRTEQECRRHEQLKFFCKCSFLEIYNEQIIDLLEPSSTNLQMREDAKKGVYVENLSEVEVQCVQDVIQLLLQGAANRKVAATNMNRESSRSHSVFTCVVESKWENNSMTNSRYGRLHLVDLAGSERQKSSGAEGGRLKEAANINKSLSTLGLVIMILVDVANGRQRHVPYRDSKLTFLLQDSLGGNSKTIMIANVSPSSCCAMETLSTLKFAQRAKFIRNNAVINEDASGDVIVLRKRIEELKIEVDRLQRENMLRVSSSRILALENGYVAGQKCGDKFDASTVDCNVIEASALDSTNANKSQTVSHDKQLRAIQAVLGGALRREQQAEDITKKLAAEIEQLNRLVRQREEDSKCSKIMLRFRDEKIRRLDGIADNVTSTEAFDEDERKNLIDELQLIRGRLDRNPELTRFAVENIRLMEELRRYQEFYDGGERDVLLEEISGLRSQLLDMLDTKVGEEQSISKRLAPQKRALAPELSALERENELLLIEVKSYQNELEECRNNLNSCLVANADLSRQVDELQATMKQVKYERSQKHEESRELLVSLDEEVPHGFVSRATHLVPQKASSADPTTTHILLETEELDPQQREALANVEEQVLELRNQLKEAQDLIQKLSSEVEHANELSDRRKLKETEPCIAEDDRVVRQGLQDRWQKLQEIEMRHAEEITQLQLELDSMEEVLKEERQQRLFADQKIDDLSSQVSATVFKLEQAERLAEDSSKEEREQRLVAEQKSEELSSQLSAAVSKLEEANSVVEALEGQQLFSINELEDLQSEHTKLLRKMKEKEAGEVELQKQFQDENTLDDPAVSILEKKLLRTKRGKEEAIRINRQFQKEKAARMALDKEREVTMSEVETQAALAITTLQSEILELREEASFAAESEATAKLQISHLQKEVELLRQTIGQLEHTNRYLSGKSEEYRNLVYEKHAQRRGLEAEWESSAAKLMDYLSDGDKALSEAVREMDEIQQTKIREISQMSDNHIVEKRDTAESVYHRLQGVQLMVRETEAELRTLSDGNASLGATTIRTFEDGEALIRESEKKSMAAFLMVGELLERIRDLKAAQHRLVYESQDESLKEATRDIQSAALQQQLEQLRRQYGELQDEHELVIREREDLKQQNPSSLDLEAVNELKADRIRLEKEIQKSCRANGEKDVENGNLHKQLDENHVQSTLMADRYQVLVAAQERLQQEHTRHLDDNTLQAKEREELVRLSDRKAMAVLVVIEQLLGGRNDSKASHMGLAKEIQDGRLLLLEKQTAIDALEQKLEQGAHEYKEIADQYELLAETYVNLQHEHNELLAEKALRVEEEEGLVKVSERKAMAAFVVLDDLLERMKELKTTNSCLAKQIGEAHGTLAEKDTALAVLHNELEDNGLQAKEREELVRLSERKAMAVRVVIEQLLAGRNDLKASSIGLAKEIQAGSLLLAEKQTAIDALEQKLEQGAHQFKEIADQYELLAETYVNLQQEHNGLLCEKALRVEEGEGLVKVSERKAMAAFVVLDDLLGRVKELKTKNSTLAVQVGEAHVTLAEKDIALAALQNLSEYSDVPTRHQVLEEAHENLREEHERSVPEKALRRTIISAKKEMQIAIANLKEAELEMDKVQRENHRLTQMQLESKSLVESLSFQLKTAEEELLRRDIKIERCEAELQKVVGVMSDWETKMYDVEFEWMKEKESLAQELTEAKLVANEKRTEAAGLLQKFQDGQATLKEAEHLVDALVKANESAKHDALDWKTEKESLGIVQGWWMPERDKLVSKLARLETDIHAQKQDIWIMCKEAVNGLVATIDVLLAVDEELSQLKNYHEQDMDHVGVEMTAMKGDVVARLLDLRGEMIKSFEDMQTDIYEMTSEKDRTLKDLADLKIFQQEMDDLTVEMKDLKGDMVDRLLDLEGEMMKSFEDMQTVVYELTSEKDMALKDLADLKVLTEQGIAQTLQTVNSEVKAVENERDKYQTDLVVLNEQLEIAQTLADEREIVAAEARQAAERSKRHAEEKEEHARILERSVEELESTVYALESQLDIVKRESERQRVVRESLEKELKALNLQIELMQVTIDSQDAQTVRDLQGAVTSKTELDRIVIEMKNQQVQARQSVESLQQECAEKDVQLRSCKAHIAELMLGAEKQASENQQKLKSLEAMVQHLKVEERKVNPVGGSVTKAVEKSTGKIKGAGSPFKCIGSSLEKQRSLDMDEDLSAAKKRIKELETVAASRQKEVFMLNTKLAEAESMTHDVVRDLLGVKMDIASYATLLNQQQVQQIADRARRRTVEAQQKEDDLDTLRVRLNEFIEERESWLEEINRRQAEAVSARVSAEKLRLRDETLTTENDKFREECHSLRKSVADLEDEIKKLSGQQNLQQRIHHHAKIKEENNSIRLQNDELSGKLRRMEILFTRLNDELARHRTAEGKTPFLNFDEEARLQKKLQETEENRLQLAETVIGLCTRIMQAAGIQRASRDLDPSAAIIALQQLQERLESLERDLSDCKLKARIAVEKRRLSDLRDFQTPLKAICTNSNFTADQQLPRPVS